MNTYIALLRGINVNGQKLIKMEALRILCNKLGFANAKTYIQSGNIVFHYKTVTTDNLAKLIRDGIQKEFGFDVPVVVLNENELLASAAKNPFLKDKEMAYLHLTFLSQVPSKALLENLTQFNFLPDAFICIDSNIYLYCPNGYGQTKLSINLFESKLKVNATNRNWKTVLELIKISGELPQ